MGRRALLAGLIGNVALFFGLGAGPANFRPGQVWKLKEKRFSAARVVVGQLGRMGDISIVHVSVLDVPLAHEDGRQELIVFSHIPMAEAAVRRSVGRQIKSRGPIYSGFDEGYTEWVNANGGVFTVTIAEALTISLESISRRHNNVDPTQ